MEKSQVQIYINDLICNNSFKEANELIEQYKITYGNDDEIFSMEAVVNLLNNNLDKAVTSVREGLRYNIFSSDLYYTMGNIHEVKGEWDRAYLCYEQALYLCNNSNRDIIENKLNEVKELNTILVNKVSIVILTHNNLEYTKVCVDSIRKYNDNSTYELILVDNNSTDGTVEWIKEQNDIKYILNNINEGFPKGCNQGIEVSNKNNDIFLLNNDTVIMPNSIFNLRMGLYSSNEIGATGSVSNSVSNYQQVNIQANDFNDYLTFSISNNIVNENCYNFKVKLVGFAMLIKREALEKSGLLDERFSPGNYEDDDLSLRIINSGYTLLQCNDSYIHHFGSVSFKKDIDNYNKLININSEKFKIKWGIYSEELCSVNTLIIDKIYSKLNEIRSDANILVVGDINIGTILIVKSLIKKCNIYFKSSEFENEIVKGIKGKIACPFVMDSKVEYDLVLASKNDDITEDLESLAGSINDFNTIISGDISESNGCRNIKSNRAVDIIDDYSMEKGYFKYFGNKSIIMGGYDINNHKRIYIGDSVVIKDNVCLSTCCENLNREVNILIHDGCRIDGRLSILAKNKVEINRNVTIGPNVYISDYEFEYRNVGIPIYEQGLCGVENECEIGENTWIGANVTIVGDVKVGRGCVIEANSYLKYDVPDYSVVSGVPAKVKKIFDSETQKWISVESNQNIENILNKRKQKPLISICIPTYNRATELDKCLRSIFNQIGNDSLFEIFISNNNSSDHTEEIVNKYREVYDNITYNKNEVNIGGDKNIALTLENSNGKYMILHGDDDYFVDKTLYKLLNIINTNRECGLFFINVLSNSGECIKYKGINEFLKQTSIYSSFISSIIISRVEFKKIREPFKFIDGCFNQIYLQYSILINNPNFMVINSSVFTYEGNEPNGYDFGEVFIKSYLDIINYFSEYGLEMSIIKCDKMRIFKEVLFPRYKYYRFKGLEEYLKNFSVYLEEYYGKEEYYKECRKLIDEVDKLYQDEKNS